MRSDLLCYDGEVRSVVQVVGDPRGREIVGWGWVTVTSLVALEEGAMPCPCHRNFPSGCINVGRNYFAPAELDPLKGIWRCFRIPLQSPPAADG